MPQANPLSPEEKRLILAQLLELRAAREKISAYEGFISREREQDDREKANYERSLELEKQATAITAKERDLALEKATIYEQLYRAAIKKPGGIKRVLCKVFTLGIGRCQ